MNPRRHAPRVPGPLVLLELADRLVQAEKDQQSLDEEIDDVHVSFPPFRDVGDGLLAYPNYTPKQFLCQVF